jgi:hypothetical protein
LLFGQLHVEQNDFDRYGGEVLPEALDVVHQLLPVGDSAGHLGLQRVARNDLDADFGLGLVEELLKFR